MMATRDGMMKNANILRMMPLVLLTIIIFSAYLVSSTVEVTVNNPKPEIWSKSSSVDFNASLKTYWNLGNVSQGDPTIGNWTSYNFTSATCILYSNWTDRDLLVNKGSWTVSNYTGTNNRTNFQNLTINSIPDSDSLGHMFYVNCTNVTESVVTGLHKLLVDSNTPKVRFNYPVLADNSTLKNNSGMLVNFTVSDRNIKYCNLLLNGVLNETNYFPTNNGTLYFSDRNLSEGNTQIEIECYDLAGNKGFNGTNTTWVVDTISPVVTVFQPFETNASWTNSAPVNITINVSETNFKACDLYVDNGNGSKTFYLNQTDTSITAHGYTSFSKVAMTDSTLPTASRFYATCNDTVNHRVNSTIMTVYLDKAYGADTIRMTTPTNGSTNPSREPWLVWTATGNPAFSRYEIKVWNRSGTVLQTTNITTNSTVRLNLSLSSLMTQASDGWFLWNVTVHDQAGNKNVTDNASYSFKVDGSVECSSLKTGWNYCGVMRAIAINASDLALEIGTNVTQVAFYNTSKVMLTYIVGGASNGNENFSNGSGVLIYASSDTEWNSRSNNWRTDGVVKAVTLTNASTGSSVWNYYGMQNTSGMTFSEIEIAFVNKNYNLTRGLMALAKVNYSGVYSYILDSGSPWNETRVDYGDGLYFAMSNINGSPVTFNYSASSGGVYVN